MPGGSGAGQDEGQARGPQSRGLRDSRGRGGGGDRAGELRCGFQGCGSAQVPAGPRGLGSVGRGRSGVCRGRGAGRGGPWRPRSCQATFPCPHPGGQEKPSGQLLESAFWSPSANREQLPFSGRLRMRPGRAGGAPLRLVLVLSQGKRGARSPSTEGETCAGPGGRREEFCGTRGQAAASLLGFHVDPSSQPSGAG